MKNQAQTNRYYLVDKSIIAETIKRLREEKYSWLEDKDGKSNLIVDQQKKVFWRVNEEDIQECRTIAAVRDNQPILFLNHV